MALPVGFSLDHLAETALSINRDSYDRCEYILNHKLFYQSVLREHFESPSKTVTKEALKEKYSVDEIKNITRILEWHFLLVYGYTLDGNEASENEPAKIKEMLGIANWVELIHPSEVGKLDSTFKLLDVMGPEQSVAYKKFIQAAKARFDENAQPNVTAVSICDIFEGLDHKAASEQLSLLSKDCQRGWAYFISILLQFDSQTDFLNQLLYDAQNSSAPGALNELMTILVNTLKSRSKKPLEGLPQLTLPGFPNWVGNGGNSCYIDATLLPLSLCLKTPIFLEISLKELTVAHVSQLRSTMQTLCPEKFIDPTKPVQEDAGCFLSGVFEACLNDPNCCKKLVLAHTFKDVNETVVRDEVQYDYRQALSARYDPHNSLLLDVSFEGASMLSSLVSIRKSRGIIDREVERKEGVEAPNKYQYVKAEHVEQYLVQSPELAPDFLCIRLLRFSQDNSKRFEAVTPDKVLRFACQDESLPVQYSLVGATIHDGISIESGHYYCILMDEEKKFVLYDDLRGQFLINEEDAMQQISSNGYIFYYRLASTKK